jgi:predicted ATPase with chaperone activity
MSPGEVTLANDGILFLDELPEFDRATLEALRQPLEDGQVAISRVGRAAVFPSRFQLIAVMWRARASRYSVGHARSGEAVGDGQVERLVAVLANLRLNGHPHQQPD